MQDLSLENFLSLYPSRSFSEYSLKELWQAYTLVYKHSKYTYPKQIVDYFLQNGLLIESQYINFDKIPTKLYIVPNQDLFTITTGIQRNSYIAYESAMYFHKLSNSVPKAVYLNFEHAQSTKKIKKTILTQEAIDTAMSNPQRKSYMQHTFEDYIVIVCNGKFTHRLGVEFVQTPNQCFYYTNLERTLIDIAVRPAYSGGVAEVLQAFKLAKGRVSIQKLFEYLQMLHYTYPYHQLIGFYLEMAGYSENEYSLFAQNIQLNFYLTYNIKSKAFSDRWKVYYPKALGIF